MTDNASIKAKIAKLLRMQQSDNAGEAANAATFVERLCREHGLTPEDINPDFDPERDEATYWVMGTPFKRVDHADWSLLNAVARHFNGRTVQRGVRMEDGFKMGADGYRYSSNVIEIQATKGNRIQIELYFTYLKEVMERLADEAKAKSVAEGYSSRSFRLNFRKGFANAIEQKLKEQKAERGQREHQKDWVVGTDNALALLKRDAIEKKAVDALVKQRYPRLRSGSGQTFGGNGTNAGRAAGRATSGHPHLHTATHGALSPS
jgi:hypothetical protein